MATLYVNKKVLDAYQSGIITNELQQFFNEFKIEISQHLGKPVDAKVKMYHDLTYRNGQVLRYNLELDAYSPEIRDALEITQKYSVYFRMY